jgi:hypothetical protein
MFYFAFFCLRKGNFLQHIEIGRRQIWRNLWPQSLSACAEERHISGLLRGEGEHFHKDATKAYCICHVQGTCTICCKQFGLLAEK